MSQPLFCIMSEIAIIKFESQYFSVKDTLECGQVFRFLPYKKGFKVYSADKCCYCYNEGDFAYIECKIEDREYFYNYFDLDRDYSLIYNGAISEKVEILTLSAKLGKGIRILNQDLTETLFSFIVSQNNNIPRIKGIIEKMCVALGEKKEFLSEQYFSFPKTEKMVERTEEFYKSIGLGYRAEYIRRLAVEIEKGLDIFAWKNLSTKELNKKLVSIYGVGRKVADCVSLFGYRKSDAFPVDTWIEKVYREDIKGTIENREKIAEWFSERFSERSGYYQQYLFFYKREKEK